MWAPIIATGFFFLLLTQFIWRLLRRPSRKIETETSDYGPNEENISVPHPIFVNHTHVLPASPAAAIDGSETIDMEQMQSMRLEQQRLETIKFIQSVSGSSESSSSESEDTVLSRIERRSARLVEASSRGQLETVKKLLAKDFVNINYFLFGIGTPLTEAARGGHSQVVFVLLQAGASPEATDWQGYTALHVAILAGPSGFESAHMILKHPQCNPNTSVTGDSRTALHFACQQIGAVDVVFSLLNSGAMVNAVDEKVRNPRVIVACISFFGVDSFCRGPLRSYWHVFEVMKMWSSCSYLVGLG